MPYFEEIVEQVEFFARCEDSRSINDPFWQRKAIDNRFYKTNPFWKNLTKEDIVRIRKELQDQTSRYISYANSLNKKYVIKLPDMSIDCWDIELVNRLLPDDCLYDCGDAYRKILFLIGKKEEKNKIETKSISLTSYMIGEEIVSNHALEDCAFYNSREKVIVGRKRSALAYLWNKILRLRNKWKQTSKLIPYIYSIRRLSGLSKQDILMSPAEGIKNQIQKVAEAYVKYSLMPHEQGHALAEVTFPSFDWNKWFQICENNRKAEGFVRSVCDVIADCIEVEGGKGKFPSIISLEEPTFSAVLILDVVDIYLSGLSNHKILEREIIEGLHDYLNTSDKGAVEEAKKKMLERAIGIAEMFHELDEKNKLRPKRVLKLRKKSEIEYKKELPNIEKIILEIQNKLKTEI